MSVAVAGPSRTILADTIGAPIAGYGMGNVGAASTYVAIVHLLAASVAVLAAEVVIAGGDGRQCEIEPSVVGGHVLDS